MFLTVGYNIFPDRITPPCYEHVFYIFFFSFSSVRFLPKALLIFRFCVYYINKCIYICMYINNIYIIYILLPPVTGNLDALVLVDVTRLWYPRTRIIYIILHARLRICIQKTKTACAIKIRFWLRYSASHPPLQPASLCNCVSSSCCRECNTRI